MVKLFMSLLRVSRTMGSQLQGLLVKGVPRLPMRLAWPPGSDIQIPCGLVVAQSRETVRVCPEQESSKPSGQNVVVLQCRPRFGGRGAHISNAAERMSIIPAGPVAQNASNTATALELPQPGSWASRARRTAHQLPAMDQARLLQPDGDEHDPRLRAVHLLRQSTQRAVDSLQRVIHTILPLKTLARFPPHRATATAPASASSVAIICPPCGFISTICAAAA